MDKDYIAFEEEIIKELDIILNTYTIGELRFMMIVKSRCNLYGYNYEELLSIYKENVKINKECIINNDNLYVYETYVLSS